MSATTDWNNEFMRLNGIPPSRMTNDENMMAYFKRISESGGYELPGAVVATPSPTPTPTPAPVPVPVPAPLNPVVPQNATAKQLIRTIIDAASALDKL